MASFQRDYFYTLAEVEIKSKLSSLTVSNGRKYFMLEILIGCCVANLKELKTSGSVTKLSRHASIMLRVLIEFSIIENSPKTFEKLGNWFSIQHQSPVELRWVWAGAENSCVTWRREVNNSAAISEVMLLLFDSCLWKNPIAKFVYRRRCASTWEFIIGYFGTFVPGRIPIGPWSVLGDGKMQIYGNR